MNASTSFRPDSRTGCVVFGALEPLESRLLLDATVQPELIFMDAARLSDIQGEILVSGSHHKAQFDALKAAVDANDGLQFSGTYDYGRGSMAASAAFLYQVTGNTAYADQAYTILEEIYTIESPDPRKPDFGSGLARAKMTSWYAMAYNYAWDAWTQTQRDWVYSKINSGLDILSTESHTNLTSAGTSNWNGVVYGGQVLAILAAGQELDRPGQFVDSRTKLNGHLGTFGDSGWTQEGNVYLGVSGEMFSPAALALAQKGDHALANVLANNEFYQVPMYGGMYGGNHMVTSWGVGGSTLASGSFFNGLLGYAPDADLPYFKWFYDRFEGIQSGGAIPIDGLGNILSMVYYPEDVAAQDPATVMSTGLKDNKGGYWFRSGWGDTNDTIVHLLADMSGASKAWDQADAFMFNILSHGAKFGAGAGTSGGPEQASGLLVDGQMYSSANDTGALVDMLVSDRGGYGIVSGGNKYSRLGLTSAQRHLLADFSSETALISTIDNLTADTSHLYTWQLNVSGRTVTSFTEAGVPAFLVQDAGGAYLKGWVLTPGATITPGDSLKVDVTSANAKIWVVMATGVGSPVTASVSGSGLSAVVTVNGSQISYDASADRIESTTIGDLQHAPQPQFTMTPGAGFSPLQVQFDASGTTDADGDTLTYTWDFGDGTTGMGINPTHTYTADGSYLVSLRVSDGRFGSEIETRHLLVGNQAPAATLEVSADTVLPGATVTFNAGGSSDPEGEALTYHWDFGDGTQYIGNAVETHTYIGEGSFTVNVRVVDPHGDWSAKVQKVRVVNQAPTARFGYHPVGGAAPLSVTFDAGESYDPEGFPLTYQWDFGDGQTATGKVVTHVYTASGTYEPKLTVADHLGASATRAYNDQGRVQVIDMSALRAPDETNVASFEHGLNYKYYEETVKDAMADFDAISPVKVGRSQGLNFTAKERMEHNLFRWTGYIHVEQDGAYSFQLHTRTKAILYIGGQAVTNPTSGHTLKWGTVGLQAGLHEMVVEYQYKDLGQYNNANDFLELSWMKPGDTDFSFVPYSAYYSRPTALETSFVMYQKSGHAPKEIFVESTTDSPDGSTLTYFWDFGDGTTSTDRATSHTYAAEGAYTIKLTVYDALGGSETLGKKITVDNGILTGIDKTDESCMQIEAQGFLTGFPIDLAFDDDINTKWIDNTGGSTWINLHFANGGVEQQYYITQYAFTSGNLSWTATRDPYNWQLLGSNNGTDWTVIDARTAEDFPQRKMKRLFDIQNPGYYSYYRFEMEVEPTASDSVELTEINLYDYWLGDPLHNGNQAPQAAFTVDASSGEAPLVVTFDATGTVEPDSNTMYYVWDFGDGHFTEMLREQPVITHSYYTSGTHTATLTVYDSNGLSDTATRTITINPASTNLAPVATATASSTSIVSGDWVSFDGAGSYDPDSDALSFHWEFGDGSAADTVTASHRYTAPGTYTAVLTVRDVRGRATQWTQDIVAADPTGGLGGIGIAFYSNGAQNGQIPPVIGAGAISMNGWNTLAGDKPESGLLYDFYGRPTTAWRSGGTAEDKSTTAPLDWDNGDVMLMRNYISSMRAGTKELTISDLPFALYDVYVYYSSESSLAPGVVTVGGQTLYVDSSVFDGVLDRSNATSSYDVVGGTDYVVFENLSDIDLSIQFQHDWGAGVAGVQIINKGGGPIARNDTATTPKDTPVVLSPLTNDIGEQMSIDSFTQPGYGSVVSNGDGTLTYTPDAGYEGEDSFTYTMVDVDNSPTVATVTLTVGNLAPIARDDEAMMDKNTTLSIPVLANDEDPEAEGLFLDSFTQGAHGIVTDNGDGTLSYTPEFNYIGSDSFSYTVRDPGGKTATATVTVNVHDTNFPPTAGDDSVMTVQDTPLVIDVLANDSDSDAGQLLSIESFTQPLYGVAEDNGDGTITYTPNPGFLGADSFEYTINDGLGGLDTATVSVQVTSPNAAWIVNFGGDMVSSSVTIGGILWEQGTDADADGLNDDTIAYIPFSTTTPIVSGTSGDSSAVYGGIAGLRIDEPAGDKTFDSRALVENGAADYLSLRDQVTAPLAVHHSVLLWVKSDVLNDGDTIPVSFDASSSMSVSFLLTQALTGRWLVRDGGAYFLSETTFTDGDVALNPTNTQWAPYSPSGWDLDFDQHSANFEPHTFTDVQAVGILLENDGVAGGERFRYQIDSFVVNAVVENPNQSPEAVSDAATVNEDGSVTVNVLGNDSDPDDDVLSVQSITQPAHGSAVDNGDGTITYTPDANFHGADSFTYTITDGNGGTDTATVSLTVTPVNDAPVAGDDSAATDEDALIVVDVLSNDLDVDAGDTLIIQSLTQPSNGSAVDNGDGTITYMPDANWFGADSFSYTVTDGNGGTDTATVNLIVNAVNDAPVAVGDAASTSQDALVVIDLLANDSDVDVVDVLSIQSITQGAHGSVVDNGDGTVTYTPDAGFTGSDSFSYDVSDGNGGTDNATVSVTVNPVAAGPQLRTGVLTDVGSGWQTVTLDRTYASMVVVATPVYDNTQAPAVVRIRNASGNSFEIRVQNPGDQTSLSGYAVQYLVVEEGVYTAAEHGVTMEAVKITSTITDRKGSWAAQSVGYANSYANPVVVGQVMTSNDAAWSVFWCNGGSSNTPPTSTTLEVGKHVGEDSNTVRADEVLGYIVIESGSGMIDGVEFAAGLGADTVKGMTNNPPFSYGLTGLSGATSAVASLAAMDGTDGGWTVLHGTTPVTATDLHLATEEDQVGDSERGHTDEQVGYIVFNYTGPVNQTPTANDDAATTDERMPVVIAVLSNDSDPDVGDVLSVQSVTQGANGAVVDNGDGTVTYTPASGFSGVDSFTYTVSDGNGGADTATVSVTVNPAPDSDWIEDFESSSAGETEETTGETIWSTDGSLANPLVSDHGTVASYVDVDDGNGGGKAFRFSNTSDGDGGFGTEYFEWTSDTVTVSASGAVTLSVDVKDDGLGAMEESDIWLDYIEFFYRKNGGSLVSFERISGDTSDPMNSTVTFANGVYGTVTEEVTVAANDTLQIVIQGRTTGSNESYFIDNVTISASTAVNNSPTLDVNTGLAVDEDASATVIDETKLSAGDVDGDPITYTLAAVPTKGVLRLNGAALALNDTFTQTQVDNGELSYQPDANEQGSDSFEFTISDGNGGTVAQTAFAITVVGLNDAPVASDDAATTDEDTPVIVGVLGNDSDVDAGDALSVQSIAQPVHGSAVDNGDGTITYTPDADWNGSDSFTYTVTDGNGGTDTATVSVTVNPVNDAPVASNDSASTNQDTAVVIAVLSNDSDPDVGDVLSVQSVTQGANGAVVDNGDGTVTYTPASGFSGVDSFTYTVSDGNGGADTATVSVTVNPASTPGEAISVNFGSQSLASGDVAGVVPVANWNNVSGGTDPTGLLNSEGVATAVSLINDGSYNYTNSTPVSTPDDKMMATHVGFAATTYVFENIPYAAYDVYLYWGGHGYDQLGPDYMPVTVNGMTYWMRHDDDVWDGAYSRSTAADQASAVNEADYVLFENVSGASLTITVSETAVANGAGRNGPCGIQIVSRSGNQAPTAGDDAAATDQDTAVVIAVLANDSDPDAGDVLGVESVTQGTNGSVTNNGTDVTYTPNAGWFGTDSFSYTVSDGNGGTDTATVTVTVNEVVPGEYTVPSTSYLGGTADGDAIRGSAVLGDGTIILAGEISDATPGGLTPILLNGATANSGGAIIRMSSDGRTVLSVTRVSSRVADLSVDSAGTLYVAAFDGGLLKLNSTADAVIWSKSYATANVWRVDATADGHVAVLTHNPSLTDLDESAPGSGWIYAYDAAGNELSKFNGYRNTLDVAMDQASQTVIHVGWRQADAWDGTATRPVQIAYFRGLAYDGTIRYTGYDWSTDTADPRFLNAPENNMADTRGYRAEIGEDGKLYLAFECAGGNHIFRYQPWLDGSGNWISATSLIAGGDLYHSFQQSKSEHKTFVGRYEPGTGEFLLGQEFTARSTVSNDATGLRVNRGNIHADSQGRLYLGCASASGEGNNKTDLGLPYTYSSPALDGGYGGGGTLIVMSADFNERLFVGRVSNSGCVRGIAVGAAAGQQIIAAAGDMKTLDAIAIVDPVQSVPGGGTMDGMFFVVQTEDNTPIAPGTFIESGGLVSVEAENYTRSAAGTGAAASRTWETTTSRAGYSGSSAMQVTGTGVNVQDTTDGPRLDYDIQFTTIVTYYIWVRMLGDSGVNDSVHVGLDGAPVSFGGSGVFDKSGSWHWEEMGGSGRLVVDVTTAGLHTLNLWMREDGVAVDKLILTADVNYIPTAAGPAESDRA